MAFSSRIYYYYFDISGTPSYFDSCLPSRGNAHFRFIKYTYEMVLILDCSEFITSNNSITSSTHNAIYKHILCSSKIVESEKNISIEHVLHTLIAFNIEI